MAGSVNKVILVGHLGRDPEVRTMANGGKVCTISLATSERWKDKNSGEAREKTEWHRVVIFDERLVDIAERYLRKGSSAYIEGQLQTRKWTDNSGVEKYSTEVVLQRFRGTLTLMGGRGDSPPPPNRNDHAGASTAATAPPPGEPGLDDEIPF